MSTSPRILQLVPAHDEWACYEAGLTVKGHEGIARRVHYWGLREDGTTVGFVAAKGGLVLATELEGFLHFHPTPKDQHCISDMTAMVKTPEAQCWVPNRETYRAF